MAGAWAGAAVMWIVAVRLGWSGVGGGAEQVSHDANAGVPAMHVLGFVLLA